MSTTQVRTRTAVVAASRPILQAGLETAVSSAGLEVDGRATPESLVMTVADTRPDLVVVAISDDGGDPFTEIARITTVHPDAKVLAITEAASIIELREAIVAGVQSLLLADCSMQDLRDAITETAEGQRVLAPEVAMQLAGSWSAEPGEGDAQLTARELQVLQWLAEGLTNASIAEELDLSARTVKTHVQNLLQKLDARDRTGAVAQGFRRGLIS